jgi:putative endonuclease
MAPTYGLAAILRDAQTGDAEASPVWAPQDEVRISFDRLDRLHEPKMLEARVKEPASMQDGAHVYIVECRDGSLYVGITRSSLEMRIAQHNAGTFPGYTASRRPVELVFSQWFDRITDAIENERRVKGWSRAKKQALIRGDFTSLQQLSKRRSPHKAAIDASS